MLANCSLISFKAIGSNGKTLKLTVHSAGYQFDCIGFNMAEKMQALFEEHGEDLWLDLAFYPGVNEWNGRRTLQLELVNLQVSSS